MPGIDEIGAPGKTVIMMGNHAIARGALEAGVGFASSYPGTPSSEILPAVAEVAKRRGIYAEWAVNEKIALESATGASLGGMRALTAMKHEGVNVTTDFLSAINLRASGRGLVMVCTDDPGPYNSPTERDIRTAGESMDIPVLDAGDWQEAKDGMKYLYDISEEFGVICILRAVNKIVHAWGNVTLGELPKVDDKAHFDVDAAYGSARRRIQTDAQGRAPRPEVLNPHYALHQKLEKIREKFESSSFNWYVGPEKAELLIITAGACWLYSQEVVRGLKLEDKVGILKLGTIYPFPEKLVASHLNKSEKILFVEEVDPFLERHVMELSASLPAMSPRPIFHGKRSGHLLPYGTQTPGRVTRAITNIMGLTPKPRDTEYAEKTGAALKIHNTARSGSQCPGCPHRASEWSIKTALGLVGGEGFSCGDIGCYGGAYDLIRTGYCMGGGIGVANGLGKLSRFGFNQPVMAYAGDSTFFHSDIPELVDAVYNDSDLILVIFDNTATSMTGFQPHPGTGRNAMGEPAKKVSIKAICNAIVGDEARVRICDPFDLKNTTATLLDLIEMEGGVRVIIMERECELIRARRDEPPYKVHVDLDKCVGESCGCHYYCSHIFLCPGLRWNPDTRKAEIDEVMCAGCGVCADVCPHGAIIREPLAAEKEELVGAAVGGDEVVGDEIAKEITGR